MRHETQYIKITMNAENAGFNRLMTQYGNVRDNEQIVLKKGAYHVHLGTYKEARDRAAGTYSVIGKGGHNYGNFGTHDIDDNLFVAVPIPHSHSDNHDLQTLRPPHPPQTGGNLKRRRSRSKRSRSKRSRSKKSRSRKSRSR
jgi:hypothetical protein